MSTFFTKYNTGIKVSLVVHLLALILLFIYGLETQLPLPPERGIVIDLGTDAAGKPDPKPIKKSPSKAKATPQPVKARVAKVNPNSRSRNNAIKALQSEIKNIDAQAKKAATQKMPHVPAPQKVNQNALFPGASASGGQGDTQKAGNQGSKTGIKGAKNYKKTEDLGAQNINFNLKGRSVVTLYKPIYNTQEEGTVVMKITVNKDGKVVTATYQQLGSTTSNYALIQAAKKAALSTRFNSGERAFQIGTIKYTFVLQ